MASHKLGRNTEDIKRELTAVLREMKDPRVSQKMLSIVRVDVSRDLSYCKAYVSAMEGFDTAKEAAKALNSAAGFIRREVGSRLTLRHVPAMSFEATDSIEYSANISHILSELNIKDGDEDDNSEVE